MPLLDLPTELLYLIYDHLHSLAELYALMRSCRKLSMIASSSKVALRLVPSPQDGSTTPPIYLWLSHHAIEDQLIKWSVKSKANLEQTKAAVRRGMHSVFELACHVTRFTLEQIRSLHVKGDRLYIPKSQQVEGTPTNTCRALVRYHRTQGSFYLYHNFSTFDITYSLRDYTIRRISWLLLQRQEEEEADRLKQEAAIVRSV